MKVHPSKHLKLIIYLFILLFHLGCSKDTDLIFEEIAKNTPVEEVVEETPDEAPAETPESGTSETTEPEESGTVEITSEGSFLVAPLHDAYIQNTDGYDQSVMKLRDGLRSSYLMFDLREIKQEINEVLVEFVVHTDPGDGTVEVFLGSDNNWSEDDLSAANAPDLGAMVGTLTKSFNINSTIQIILDPSEISADKISLVLLHKEGNDLAFASKENTSVEGPKLRVNPAASEILPPDPDPVDPDPADETQQEETTQENVESNPCDYGGDCMIPDQSCIDSSSPDIQHWVNAGVVGGIPSNLQIIKTIGPNHNLQNEIYSAASSGGGVIVLSAGTYAITSTLIMKSNVVLRGVDKNSVILESTVRGYETTDLPSILFDDVTNSGLENITHFYRVDGCEPADRDNLDGGIYDESLFPNNPCGRSDIIVTAIEFDETSSNNWIDNCNILESGNHAIKIAGDHNTVRNSLIDRAYNKGGGGRGYFEVTGNNNLLVQNTIKRIRHLTIHLKAKYNVVFKNTLWVDVNFHDNDNGHNLIEQNTITTPTWHAWPIVETGRSVYGHQPPGPDNVIFNNNTDYKQTGFQMYGQAGTIYTLIGFESVVDSHRAVPSCNTFYPMLGN